VNNNDTDTVSHQTCSVQNMSVCWQNNYLPCSMEVVKNTLYYFMLYHYGIIGTGVE